MNTPGMLFGRWGQVGIQGESLGPGRPPGLAPSPKGWDVRGSAADWRALEVPFSLFPRLAVCLACKGGGEAKGDCFVLNAQALGILQTGHRFSLQVTRDGGCIAGHGR
jgi:hypothetical protein